MTNANFLYNKDAAEVVGKNYFAEKNLGVTVVERGTVVPYVLDIINGRRVWKFGGLVGGNGRFIKGSVGEFDENKIFTPTEKVTFVPATVVYLGVFFPVWGHFLADGLRYFWALQNDEFKKFFGDCPLVYVPWELKYYFDREENFRRLAEILSLDFDKLVPIERPVQFEKVVLIDESFFLDVDGLMKFTDAYRETIDRVRNFALKNQSPTSAKKIYFFYGSVQVGEERLAEYFRGKGYEIVSPEKLTLDEQLNLLISAESFASTLGSCSHNSIFLRDGAEAIFIPRAANRLTAYQPTLDQIHPLNANYIDSSLSIFVSGNGPYCFIISEQLKKFFGEEFTGYTDDDFKIFLAYVKISMSRGLKLNSAAMQYYAPVYQKFIEQLRQREDLLKAYGIVLK